VWAKVVKKEMMKRLPINMGKLKEKALMIVPMQTPSSPKNMCFLRPYQSAIQMKKAPHISPTCVFISNH
jgi:hypothetical protein